MPFWTSNIIRMISWIPLLGKEGLINSALLKVGLIHEPLEFLLFSGFAVVVAYVHQLTIFMIVPIFNSMGRIDKRVVEAAIDAGASRFDIMRYIILPLSKSGIALGSIFVVSIVMGDFFVIKVMSGGGSASVVGALLRGRRRAAIPERRGERGRPHHPGYPDGHRRSCAPSISARKSRDDARCRKRLPRTRLRRAPAAGRGPSMCWRTVFTLYVIALYGPMICIYILSFQDVRGGLVFPMKGFSLHWFVDLFTQVRTGDVKGAFDRSIKLAVVVTIITVVVSFLAGLAFRRRFRGDNVVFSLMIGSLVAPGLVLGIGVGLLFNALASRRLVLVGARRATVLDAAVRRAGDVRGDVAFRSRLGRGGARSRRLALADHPAGDHSDPGAGPRGGRVVRLHAVL